MGKIKNQTETEREIHKQAVALRKLTDKQLIERLNTVEPAPVVKVVNKTMEFIEELEKAGIFGIGKVTIKKISAFAKEKGYI